MLRLCKQGMMDKWYGIEIDSIKDDLENIECFISEGSPVLLCEDIEAAVDSGIDKDDITIVGKYEEEI